jgi:hypothetical protein
LHINNAGTSAPDHLKLGPTAKPKFAQPRDFIMISRKRIDLAALA